MQLTLTTASVEWVEVIYDGSGVQAKCIVNATEPSTATFASTAVTYASANFRTNGGMIGFTATSNLTSIDEVKVYRWDTGTSAYDVEEHYDGFTLDSSSTYYSETFTYDNNGNLTWDGLFQYTYDGCNRLISATHGYRDSGGTLQSGSKIETISYDALNRRISKAIANYADLNGTYHYFYKGQRLIEERDGSNDLLKQYVWAGAADSYIDELCQIAINSNPTSSSHQNCDTLYIAMQDANYNVIGLVDSTGTLKERYEYWPYGQRTVYFSKGSSDAGCYDPAQT